MMCIKKCRDCFVGQYLYGEKYKACCNSQSSIIIVREPNNHNINITITYPLQYQGSKRPVEKLDKNPYFRCTTVNSEKLEALLRVVMHRRPIYTH